MTKLNRYQFIGNLGQDAQVRQLDGSTRCAISFSVAVTEKWKNQRGEQQEKTTWVSCTLWRDADKTAIAQYLRKGQMVLVEGQPSARAYTNNQGQPAASLEVTVNEVNFLGGSQQAGQGAPAANAPAPGQPASGPGSWPNPVYQQYQQAQASRTAPAGTAPLPPKAADDDDLPF